MKTFFKDRYDASHEAGKTKLLSGTIPLFAGVTEAMKGDLIVAIKLKEEVSRFFRLFLDLEAFEDKGFAFFMTGRNFPFHVTVQAATGGHGAETELRSGRNYIQDSTLMFNRLVLDGGGNIVLMNEGVLQEISEWRGFATQVMVEHGGVPKPLPIFHATVARIVSFNHSAKTASQLVEGVENWNQALQEYPLQLVSGGTYVGTVYDLLQTA